MPSLSSKETINPIKTPVIACVPGVFDVTQGAKTPFGQRWGGDVFKLTDEHLAALRAGQTLALDVQGEYVAFLKHATQPPAVPAPAPANTQPQTPPDAKIGASGYGG